MARLLTTSDLIADVRSVLDESNQASIDDTADIIPALNRAQDYASNILARHYECPLLTFVTVTPTAGDASLDIPDDAFEQRIEKVEVSVSGNYIEVPRVSYRELYQYEAGTAQVAIPLAHALVGNEYRLAPTPSGAYPLRVWYLRDPAPLVLGQGRVTAYNTSAGTITVDSAGDELSTEMDQLESFVNLIDGSTGAIRATLQIRTIEGNRLSFRTSPARSTVLGRTVATAVPSTVEEDDYLCSVSGTCIPVLKKPFSNFLIQYAVAELQRKLGGPADAEQAVLKELERQVERSWVGREQSLRVKAKSRHWAGPGQARRVLVGN